MPLMYHRCLFVDLEADLNQVADPAPSYLCANQTRHCVYLPTRWPLHLVGVRKHRHDSDHCAGAHTLSDVQEYSFWEHGGTRTVCC